MEKVRKIKGGEEFIVEFGKNLFTNQTWKTAKEAYAWLKGVDKYCHENRLNRL